MIHVSAIGGGGEVKTICPKWKAKSLFEPGICWWWTPLAGWGHCQRLEISQCDTQGLRHAPRADSDDDGEPD